MTNLEVTAMNKVPYRIPQPNNMGIVRYILAFAVVIAHFNTLTDTDILWFPITSGQAVGGFFALSGFLMAGSYLKRPDWKNFVISRCKRLLPAYWSTVLIFAVICVAFSSADNYFVQSGFWKYLTANLSFLNFLHPTLPGVFDNNPTPVVNGSLWTMKVEWMLYLTVPFGIWLIMKFKRHVAITIMALYVASAVYRLGMYHMYDETGSEIYAIMSRQFLGMLMYFYVGILVYYYLDLFLKWKWWILAISLVSLLAFSKVGFFHIVFDPLFVSLLVLWFSMVGKWGSFEGTRDNISYNIYLVHFPVIQIIVQTGLTKSLGIGWSFAIAILIILAISWLICGLIEKPLQRRWKRNSISK